MRNHILLNNNNSLNIRGLLIQSLPPISLPKMRTRTEEIDGRDGDIITRLGYSAYDKKIKIGLTYNYDVDEVIAYFNNNSSGEVVFSNESDKIYRYELHDQIDFERLLRFKEAEVTFHCQPYKYDATETEIDFTNTYTEDTEPYIFRANQHDANSMKLKKVVGGTIAWNQMWNADREATVTAGTPSFHVFVRYNYYSFVAGHKYLATYTQKNSMGSNTRNTLEYNDGTTHYQNPSPNRNLTAGNYNWMFSASNSTTNGYISIWCHTPDVDVTYANPQLFDLTQMFGSTIADYIYSLEQAHAGDGVAWFKALFGEDYYPYNSGELMSVQTSAHKTVGFNQWDEEWEVGGIDTSGQPNSTNNEMRCKNYIPALPNTQYCFTVPVWGVIYQYDADKNFLLRTPLIGGDKSPLFTTLTNTAYIKFFMQSAYGTTYNHDICINLSSSRNGEYEPYEEHTYPLDSDLELRGIPKLDADHNLYYDGDTYASDGTVTRRYGVVDLGSSTLGWQRGASGDHYVFDSLVINKATGTNFVCPKYVNARTYRGALLDKQMGVFNLTSGTYRISIRDDSYSDASSFTTAMDGVYLVYELATPTTESADAYTQSQRVGATEEFVDERSVPIPVGNESEYYDGTPEIVVKNKGNTTSRPTLTIYGEGTITVSLNGNEIFSIEMGDNEYIEIDTEQMNAYMGGVLLNRNVTGDYSQFALQTGDNTLSFTGSVTNVLIDRYSRWI